MLARGFFLLRKLLVARYGLLASVLGIFLLMRGFFDDIELAEAYWAEVCLGGLLGLSLVGKLFFNSVHPRASLSWRLDRLDSGLLWLINASLLIQITGGPGSPFQPLAYLMVAYLVGFNERGVGLLLTLAACGIQGTLHLAAGEIPGNWEPFLTQVFYLAAFAAGNFVLLQGEVIRRRREYRQELDAEIRARQDEARDFRLISSALDSGAGQDRAAEESKLAQGAVESIHQGMFFVLELLKKSLDLQTCVLMWLDETGQRLKIKELVTSSTMVKEVPISAHAGALGGVIKNRLLLNLQHPRQGSRGIPYYEGPEQVGAFLGVPVMEGSHLRGVLCADRREDRGFEEAEEQLMVEATRQILRALQTERVFTAVERSKYEHERFYSASTMLNNALTLAQVYDTAFAAAREIAEFGFGALTLYDAAKKKHIICRMLGDQRERFEGQQFGDNAGLVSMVVKNKHFLPATEDLRERDTMIFTRKLRIRGLESLIVLPLIIQDNAIGTFILASKSSGRFSKKTREMLGVISNQVAVSIENAKMYKKMEEMATIDGLTGLPNHRTFQSRTSEMIYRAERHGKPVSVVLTDIDKFKNVNDTYGHPVGDEVLRRVSKVLADQIRKVDIVARYGGEEFAMVLEETDEQGAMLFCERVRQEIAAQLMSSEKGSFRVTISLGIATYPSDGVDKQTLITRADQALYAAKEGGRNRTMLYSMIKKVNHVAHG